MLIPDYLNAAILEIAQLSGSKKTQIQSSKDLSLQYRVNPKLGYTKDLQTRYIYLKTRMPATYAVLSRVLQIFLQKTNAKIETILDLGSGPGTSIWSLYETLSHAFRITCVEKDTQMQEIAKSLFNKVNPSIDAVWINDDLLNFKDKSISYDALILSYVLNEIDKDKSKEFFKHLTSFNTKYIILIEAGTQDGYRRILNMRKLAIYAGWNIVAPCPHLLPCPLESGSSWCHFYQRVQRTKEHKMAKGATMGYEDEKFSYLILSSEKTFQNTNPVVLSFPTITSGFVDLKVCNTNGQAENIKVMRKNKESYKAAKKMDWGSFYREKSSQSDGQCKTVLH